MKQQIVDRAVAVAGVRGVGSLVQLRRTIDQAQSGVPMIAEQRLNIEATGRMCGHVGCLLMIAITSRQL
jgi:hypothetical protein